MRGKDSGTLVGTRTAVCVWVSGQGLGLEAVAEGGSGSRAFLVPPPQAAAPDLGSCRSPLCVSPCTPKRWTRRQRSASWSCASEHGSYLVDRWPEGVAEPWFGVCPPPSQPQPTALVTSLLGTWSTAAPGSSLSTSPDGVAGPPREHEVTGQDSWTPNKHSHEEGKPS